MCGGGHIMDVYRDSERERSQEDANSEVADAAFRVSYLNLNPLGVAFPRLAFDTGSLSSPKWRPLFVFPGLLPPCSPLL